MKLILTSKTGKRVLVDTLEIPNYKELYNDENGKPFGTVKEVKAPKVVKPKPKKTVKKKTTKKVTKK